MWQLLHIALVAVVVLYPVYVFGSECELYGIYDEELVDLSNESLSKICNRIEGIAIPSGNAELYTHDDYVRLANKCLHIEKLQLTDVIRDDKCDTPDHLTNNVQVDAMLTGSTAKQIRNFYVFVDYYDRVMKYPDLTPSKDGLINAIVRDFDSLYNAYRLEFVKSPWYPWSESLTSAIARMYLDMPQMVEDFEKRIGSLTICETEIDFKKESCNMYDLSEEVLDDIFNRTEYGALVNMIVDDAYKSSENGRYEFTKTMGKLYSLLMGIPGSKQSIFDTIFDMLDHHNIRDSDLLMAKLFERRDVVEYIVATLLKHYPNPITMIKERDEIGEYGSSIAMKVKRVAEKVDDLRQKDESLFHLAISHLIHFMGAYDEIAISKVLYMAKGDFHNIIDKPDIVEYIIRKLIEGEEISQSQDSNYYYDDIEMEIQDILHSIEVGDRTKPARFEHGGTQPIDKDFSKKMLSLETETPQRIRGHRINSVAWALISILSSLVIGILLHYIIRYGAKNDNSKSKKKRNRRFEGRTCDGPNCSNMEGQRLASKSDKKKKGKKVRLQECSACMEAYYCSNQCQEQAWPEHKRYCRMIQASLWIKRFTDKRQ